MRGSTVLRRAVEWLATHREFSALLAFHFLLAELRSAKQAWIMSASAEEIPYEQTVEEGGLVVWARQRLEREHLEGRAEGLEAGRAEGLEAGRAEGLAEGRDAARRALLDVARHLVPDEVFDRLSQIDDVDALTVAVREALEK